MDQKTIQRRLTKAFVYANPVTVRMRPISEQEMPDGGTKRIRGSRRSSQVITLCEPGSSGYGPPDVSVQGRTSQTDFLLVAEYGETVQEHDEFEVDGHAYRVDKLLPDNGYEVRAFVVQVS